MRSRQLVCLRLDIRQAGLDFDKLRLSPLWPLDLGRPGRVLVARQQRGIQQAVAQAQGLGHRRALLAFAQQRQGQVVLPRLAQELGDGRRQSGVTDTAIQLGAGTGTGHFQLFLAALGLGSTALGDFHTAAMLHQELAEFFFQGAR
ncbi:hypothetical protein G6F32_015077 [Rhizopus arrhizus]|nr:hypothetical protein G6F32_015077 [Rhizopus arrhizus]